MIIIISDETENKKSYIFKCIFKINIKNKSEKMYSRKEKRNKKIHV